VFGYFLQTDPVGYKSDLDLYAYVGDDPVDRTDPSGNGPLVPAFAAAGCAVTAEVGCVEGAMVGAGFGWGVEGAVVVGVGIGALWDQIVRNHATPPEQARQPGDKKPPTPKGSRGSQEHQGKIKDRIKDLEGQGMTHVGGGDKPEETVPTPGGEKGTRRPDVSMDDPATGSRYRENVGRQNQRGDPVARERRAQDDIRNATGQCGFTSYNGHCK
jgi:hypothetical protein